MVIKTGLMAFVKTFLDINTAYIYISRGYPVFAGLTLTIVGLAAAVNGFVGYHADGSIGSLYSNPSTTDRIKWSLLGATKLWTANLAMEAVFHEDGRRPKGTHERTGQAF